MSDSSGSRRRARRAERVVKRLLDVAIAGTALVLLSPVIAAVALAVAIRIGRPILFRQMRPGLHGHPFLLVKFRTMSDLRDRDGKPLPDEYRLTPLGQWLRSTSLDELPELWNIVKGDMSLVGPRPLLMQYLPRYTAEQARRHEVRPGLTGWAQVNGRNALTWDEKFAHDIWYVDHWNFVLDLRILVLSALSVFRRHGIAAEGSATMPEFIGSARDDRTDPDP